MTEISKDILSNSLDFTKTNLDNNSKKNRVLWRKIKDIFSKPNRPKKSLVENELEMNYESGKSLHDILSNLVREEAVIEEILEKTSHDTKLRLARSNFNLNEKEEDTVEIDRFIYAINFINDYLKKYENDLAKFIDPIKENHLPKHEPKRTLFRKKNQLLIDEDNKLISEHLKIISDFKILITTRSSNFVDVFLRKNGLDSVIDLLSSLKYEWRYHAIHFNLIHCVRGILNCNSGCHAVLNHERALSILVQSIYVSDVKLKIKVIEIISPLCLWNIGREKILGAFTQFKNYARESYRFQYIVNLLAFYDGFDESLNEKLKVSILSLINLIIGDKNSHKKDDLSERLLLRMEFIKLGLQDIVSDMIREKSALALDRHLDYYEYSRMTDENCFLEFSKDQDHLENKCLDSQYFFESIERHVKLTSVNTNWMSVLEHLYVLTSSKPRQKMQVIWYTIDRMVSQVVLGEKNIHDFEDILIQIGQNMQHLEEIKNLNSRLERSEQEMRDLRVQNSSLIQEVMELRDRLNQESKIAEVKENLNKRVLSSSTPKQNSKKLNVFKQPDELNDIDLSLLTPNTSVTFFPSDSPAVPPPPPPPLPTFSLNIQKKVPKSNSQMKPVHINKIVGNPNATIWENVDEVKYYSKIDLKKIEQAFLMEEHVLTSRTSSLICMDHNMDSLYSLPIAPKSIFVDPMRSISVNVARRKLPSSDELVDIIEKMDPEQKLGETEISNLQQLVLSSEEKANLYSCNLSQMDELHNCLYKISKIMYYSEKLEIIRFKNSLKDQTTSQLNSIKLCCSSLKENKNVLKLLELVLCIVNYVNQNNQNGNAFGFKLNFLNKLSEIKTNERGFSLLHYLIIIIKDHYPELIKLPEELETVKKMVIFNITDLSNEILNLENKMKKINELMRKMKIDTNNFEKNKKFFDSMEKFYEDNKKRIESTRTEYNDALKKYDEISKYFGESGSLTNFNDFFLIWSTFIKTFSNVRDDLEKKSIKESKSKFLTVSNKDGRRTNVTKRINQRNDSELSLVLNNLGNDSDFNRFCSEIQSGEIFTRNKAIRRDFRNRTKSYNMSKGANSRSRSPSVV